MMLYMHGHAYFCGRSIISLVKYIPNKNTMGVKKYGANKKHPYLCAIKSFDIS